MQCRECLSHLSPHAMFCEQCGSKVGRLRGGRGPVTWVGMGLVLLVAVAIIYVYVTGTSGDPTAADPDAEVGDTVSRSADVDERPGDVTDAHDPTNEVPDLVLPVQDTPAELVVGMVRADDRWEVALRRFPAAVVSGSWLAAPRRAGLGARRLVFRPDQHDEEILDAAVWRPGEDLVLWQLAGDAEYDSLELVPWDNRVNLEWLSLTGEQVRDVHVRSVERRDIYDVFPVAERLRHPGVFIQRGAVVGWTFGAQLPGGWLYSGGDASRLMVDSGVARFYDLTFAGGREESMRELEVRDDLGLVEEFRLLLRALGREPKLTAEEARPDWRFDAVVNGLVSAVVELDAEGLPEVVVRELRAPALVRANSAVLLQSAVAVTSEVQGPESAVALLTAVRPELTGVQAAEDRALDEMEQALYVTWIRIEAEGGNLQRAWYAWDQARDALPDDGDIHLYGVEIALLEGRWRDAQSIYDERNYLGSLAPRAERLAERIRRLSQSENAVVVRFRPGARSIPATATLNGDVDQRFIVDTGATTTTIPSATARDLGIRITAATPRRLVSTAGGAVEVPQVRLSSVDLSGAKVLDLDVLVLDIPGQSGLGLIGTDFLRNFRYEVNTEEGTLLLEPR